jgi:hypothetical protein
VELEESLYTLHDSCSVLYFIYSYFTYDAFSSSDYIVSNDRMDDLSGRSEETAKFTVSIAVLRAAI